MLALSVTLVQRQVLAALAHTVTTALDISDVNYGWLSSALASAYLVGSLPGARLMQRLGPRVGLAVTLAITSIVIGLHSEATGFWGLLCLRAALGLAVAPSFACATQAIHRVLPFRDRGRGIGLLYMGNSLGSAACPPIAVVLESIFGWRQTFFWVGVMGIAWVPLWIVVAFSGRARTTLDPRSIPPPAPNNAPRIHRYTGPRVSLLKLAMDPGVLRGCLVVAAAAPVTTVMLLWASKYLMHDHGLTQTAVGRYLWLPALLFGAGSMVFGELRSRSARTRADARPPRRLMVLAMLLCVLLAAVPFAHGPRDCTIVASLAMMGAGGLYTLATSDMLAHTPRRAVTAATGFTTLTQSLVYIIVSPIIGKLVEHFGNYRWVMIYAGLWVLPGCIFWLIHSSLRDTKRSAHAR
jgi:ACS family hexuronate transporter-like MFS transporter